MLPLFYYPAESATGTSSFVEPPCCACLHCLCLHCLFRGYYILMKLNYLLFAQFITSLLNSYRRMQKIEFTALSVGRFLRKLLLILPVEIFYYYFFLRFKKSTFFICARLIQGLIFLSLGIILIPSSSSGVPCRVRIGSLWILSFSYLDMLHTIYIVDKKLQLYDHFIGTLAIVHCTLRR